MFEYLQAIALGLTEEGLPSRAYERDPQHKQNIVIKLMMPSPRKHLIYTACLNDCVLMVGTCKQCLLRSFDISDPKLIEKVAAFIKTAPDEGNITAWYRYNDLEVGDILENWIIHSNNFGPDTPGPTKAYSHDTMGTGYRRLSQL
jgi:hypothetical protein